MELASFVEHTLLRADATPADIERHCREAVEHRLFGVCISPLYVPLAKRCLAGTPVRVVTVAGFPLGASASDAKAEEARIASVDGADEIDMVIAVGFAVAGDFGAVEADIRAVRAAVPARVLKVIVETGYLDEVGIRRAAEAAVRAGADFVKTSTGFGPRGATVGDVALLYETVAGRAGVKASGGIRTAKDARALIEAGATRIGTSNGVAMVRGV
jgi:deoxyribose-phosphate aldolase